MTISVPDLIEYSMKAWLLLFLCKDSIELREKYRSVGKILFFLQAFLAGYLLSHSDRINRLIYGNEAGVVTDSSQSIIKLAIVFGCSFLIMDLLYQGRKLAKLYLLLVFYTVQEMAKFTLHSVWSLAIKGCIDSMNELIIAEQIGLDGFYRIIEYLQTCSMWFFVAGYLLLMYVVLRWYRKYLAEPVEEIDPQGLWFLMLMPIIGMAFDILWRISFYRQNGTEIDFLYERHGSMYVVVPAIAVLCLICIGFSRKIYSELMCSEAQKNKLLFYKRQLSDMTEHVRELEQLYDGIRGMRHDVNNYVADMEQLLCMSTEAGQLPDRIRKEAEGYLRSMQCAADRLSLQFCTGNPVTDVILNRKGQICTQEQIMLEGELLYPAELEIEAFDLGILLNNALDNAIEACRKVSGDKERSICFRGYIKGRIFFIVVENTYDGRVLQQGINGPLTSKADRKVHGVGMSNMRSCVEKYYGTMQYETDHGRFVLTIMLQGKVRQSDAAACFYD